MMVKEGDRVRLGEPLFSDKKTPGVLFTAPAAGRIAAVNRGAKRVLQSVVIEVDAKAESLSFPNGDGELPERDQLVQRLVESGLWTAFRTRPYSRIPAPNSRANSIFVSVMDTNPLAADPAVVLADRQDDFELGLKALTILSEGAVHLGTAPGAKTPGTGLKGVEVHEFDGPHPAGLVGTHIHFVDPVNINYQVWTIGYQDVAALGYFLRLGQIDTKRVIAIAGPAAAKPRLVSCPLGASIAELAQGEVKDGVGEARLISGSVLCGTATENAELDRLGFLGRFDVQLSIVEEGRHREFIGWHMPGGNKYSIKRIYSSALSPSKKFAMTTNVNGSPRAMVPVGSFEQVMPLDIFPTFLLRALMTKDTDYAQQLGALELDEEDLGLCTFVCPGKEEYGQLLRENLTFIERNG